MKILYGVQGTGNGHLTRAHALNRYFGEFGIEAEFLFSGRARKDYFDMDDFGPSWRCFEGLTFVHEAGSLSPWETLKRNNLGELWKNIKELDLSHYDLVLTDFEPISAWAARRQGVPCIGVGHQYAFAYSVPKTGENLYSRQIMKNFAPANVALGLHWHHFNAPILPPIAETHANATAVEPGKYVVYLGFEDPEEVMQMLEPFEQQLFVFYGPFPSYESRGHIQLKPLSREGFRLDLASAEGVISNAGFELSSEAIQLGKKLLVKPLQGQMEQLSNARALEQLGLGMSMHRLDRRRLAYWLDNFESKRVCYPNVAKAIVQWLSQGNWQATLPLVKSLWSQVSSEDSDPVGQRQWRFSEDPFVLANSY